MSATSNPPAKVSQLWFCLSFLSQKELSRFNRVSGNKIFQRARQAYSQHVDYTLLSKPLSQQNWCSWRVLCVMLSYMALVILALQGSANFSLSWDEINAVTPSSFQLCKVKKSKPTEFPLKFFPCKVAMRRWEGKWEDESVWVSVKKKAPLLVNTLLFCRQD